MSTFSRMNRAEPAYRPYFCEGPTLKQPTEQCFANDQQGPRLRSCHSRVASCTPNAIAAAALVLATACRMFSESRAWKARLSASRTASNSAAPWPRVIPSQLRWFLRSSSSPFFASRSLLSRSLTIFSVAELTNRSGRGGPPSRLGGLICCLAALSSVRTSLRISRLRASTRPCTKTRRATRFFSTSILRYLSWRSTSTSLRTRSARMRCRVPSRARWHGSIARTLSSFRAPSSSRADVRVEITRSHCAMSWSIRSSFPLALPRSARMSSSVRGGRRWAGASGSIRVAPRCSREPEGIAVPGRAPASCDLFSFGP
mmetsp:Transcript_503/g.1564  ORF Transcript_503/g.1564 Transcript_503/m.1564 type:complete len:315 (-) Transcript_503:901-1845(-)